MRRIELNLLKVVPPNVFILRTPAGRRSQIDDYSRVELSFAVHAAPGLMYEGVSRGEFGAAS